MPPVLRDIRRTKTITLPAYPDSQVEIYDSLLVGDALKGATGKNTPEEILNVLPSLIKGWNFVDEQGKVLAVNTQTLKMLTAPDLQYILEQVTEFANESKKKLSG